MNISQQIFQYFNSSAANPVGYGIFPLVESEIYMANAFVRTLMGDKLFNELEDLPPAFDVTDGDLRLQVAAARFICISAYDRAIPHLDLVLTNDGFGVVSNDNLTPASAERVERLRKHVKAQADDALDELIDALRFCDGWRTSPLSRPWFDSFFWRGSLASELGCTEPHRSALVPLRTAIAGAETELRNHISPEFVDELLCSIRCAVKSASYDICCTMCRRFIAARVAGNAKQASDMLRSIFSFLDANIGEFPTYRGSKAYAANHFSPYENKKYDSCYFFGY